jgi:DNA-binding response OmpR family regulator
MGAGRDARRDTKEMRLLLVEDNARLSALMVAGLSKAGFATDAFTMAVEAEAAIHSVAYSAMI